MRMKLLSIALMLTLVIGLTGCFFGEIEFPVSEIGFPIGFTRISDGVQIYIGMNRYEVESVMGSGIECQYFYGAMFYDIVSDIVMGREVTTGRIRVQYYNDMVTAVGTASPNWAIVDGVSAGNNIQS